jgi:protein involved in polysaccharide export with SLBB domain
MKYAALVAVLAGILGGSPITAPYETPLTQENQEERFFVVGFVNKPGSYRFTKKTITVGEAIEAAGGVTERGATDRFRIFRQQDGKRLDLEVQADEPITPNDTISVFRKAL